jgi:hypothetical protein
MTVQLQISGKFYQKLINLTNGRLIQIHNYNNDKRETKILLK